MALTHTSEEYAALSRRVEYLSRTVDSLTQTVTNQNELIQSLLKDPAHTHVSKPRSTTLTPSSTSTSFASPSMTSHSATEPLFTLLPSAGRARPLGLSTKPTQPTTAPTFPKSSTTQPSGNFHFSFRKSPPRPSLAGGPAAQNTVAAVPSAPSSAITSSPTMSSPLLSSPPHTAPARNFHFIEFPLFGREWLPELLRWWWYPTRRPYCHPEALRSWGVSDMRLNSGGWYKAELIAKAWHIMKGHELRSYQGPALAWRARAWYPLDERNELDLANLDEDVKQWRERWGDTMKGSTEKIKAFLAQNPAYGRPSTESGKSKKRERTEGEAGSGTNSGESAGATKKARIGVSEAGGRDGVVYQPLTLQ